MSFSSIALLATTAFLRIFWKEIAEANSNKNTQKMEYLYTRFSRILYFISATLACSMIFWTEELVTILLGENYIPGHTTLLILFFIPLHQSLIQIQSSFLYATESSKLLSVTASIMSLLGLIFAYFIMAPKNAYIPGLEMGANGLAIKMIVFQIIIANILNYLISRKMSWKFECSHQAITILVCLLIACFSSYFSRFMTDTMLFGLLINFVFYFIAIGVIIILIPSLIGLSKKEFRDYFKSS